MGLFRRGEELPEPVRAAMTLGPGDRLMASAREASGDWLVATAHTIARAAEDGALRWRRSWSLVDSGSWSADDEMLTVSWMDDVDEERWRLAGTGAFLPAFRERVQSTVVLGRDVSLNGLRVARAVIRKEPATGELTSQVRMVRGATMSDPAVAAEVRHALAELRDDVGL